MLGFMDDLLVTIGSQLELEAGRYLAFHGVLPVIGWPKGLLYLVNQKTNRILRTARSVTKTVSLAKTVITLRSGGANEETNSTTTTEEDQDRVVEEQLLGFIDTAGSYILSDVASALQGGCWRLFYDTGVDAQTKRRRAEALAILGEEIRTVGQSRRGATCADGSKKKSGGDPFLKAEGVKEKVMRAFELSQRQA